MLKTSTKLILTGAASLLGVALATGGAYAATGSLTSPDVPGHALHVNGVGPASEHAVALAKKTAATAKASAEKAAATAKGSVPEATDLPGVNSTASQGVAASAHPASPVVPNVTATGAASATGGVTGSGATADAGAKAQVQTVAPNGAVSVGAGTSVALGK